MSLPEEQEGTKGSISMSSQQTVSFAGPLPPPHILQKYGDIGSTYPERIFIMAEKEQNSAHELQREAIFLERMRIENQAQATKKGQYLSTVIVLLFLFGAVYATALGRDSVAIAMVGFPLVGIIAVMITGRHKSH